MQNITSQTEVASLATVILQLISVQIKVRRTDAELCWLITRSCKGFQSLSRGANPTPIAGILWSGPQKTWREWRWDTIVNTQLAYVGHDWLASSLPDCSNSLQRRHLRASDWCFGPYTSKANYRFLIHACHLTLSPKMASLPWALLLLIELDYIGFYGQTLITMLCF